MTLEDLCLFAGDRLRAAYRAGVQPSPIELEPEDLHRAKMDALNRPFDDAHDRGIDVYALRVHQEFRIYAIPIVIKGEKL